MIPDDADLYLVTAELGEDGSLAVQYTLEVGISVVGISEFFDS